MSPLILLVPGAAIAAAAALGWSVSHHRTRLAAASDIVLAAAIGLIVYWRLGDCEGQDWDFFGYLC